MGGLPVVSIREKPKGPVEHFVRMSRGENGCGFIVGYVDHTGIEDFRSQTEHQTYDEALKEAQRRAHDCRRPMRDETGVEPDPKAEPAANRTKDAPNAGRQSSPFKSIDETQPICAQFALPELQERIASIDFEPINDRACALYREQQDALTKHGAASAPGQIIGLFQHISMTQAVLYAYLERAFDRIDQLEQANSALQYRGIFKETEAPYEKGSLVTYGGSCWHANELTSAKPGDDHDAWTLMVRKGRDGKDVRDRKE